MKKVHLGCLLFNANSVDSTYQQWKGKKMITYSKRSDGEHVILDGTRVGIIKKVEGGFQYWPQGKKKYADPNDIADLAQVKKWVEGND